MIYCSDTLMIEASDRFQKAAYIFINNEHNLCGILDFKAP